MNEIGPDLKFETRSAGTWTNNNISLLNKV